MFFILLRLGKYQNKESVEVYLLRFIVTIDEGIELILTDLTCHGKNRKIEPGANCAPWSNKSEYKNYNVDI